MSGLLLFHNELILKRNPIRVLVKDKERCQKDVKNGFFTMPKSDKKCHFLFIAQ